MSTAGINAGPGSLNPGEDRMLSRALQLLERGWSMVPSRGENKAPCVIWKPFQLRLPTSDQLRIWQRQYSPVRWGPVTGAVSGIVVVDFDGPQGKEWLNIWRLTPHVQTGSGGHHVYFEHPGWNVSTMNARSSAKSWKWPGVDVRGDGGFAVLLGTNSRGPYTELRELNPEPFTAFPAELAGFLKERACPASSVARQPPAGRVSSDLLIGRALGMAGSHGGRNDAGFWLAGQLRDNGYSETEADAAMCRYAAAVPASNAKGQRETYTAAEARASLRSAYRQTARQPWGAKVMAAPDPPNLAGVHTSGGGQAPDLIGYLHNDHGNAERLIAMYGGDLRYCHAFRKWLVWDGRRWEVDDTDQARRRAKETMLEFFGQVIAKSGAGEAAEKFARLSLDAKRISSMLSMAECEIFVRPDALDTDPFALNFLNGTVDLRTGDLRVHCRADLITKLIHYEYRPDARCPRWTAFLGQIMGAGPDASEAERDRARRLTAYLQRALGYSLTGSTSEKAVFILFGEGNNGKSTMLSTIRGIAEEYSALLQVDTLMARQESNNTHADLADLRGARFVQTSETEEGQRFAQGKLKRITQGMGKIKAVRKYENPIEFPETHKLWIDTNRKPTIRNTDDKATLNRLHPIPFLFSLPADQIDKHLPGKLMAEAGGIIAWAVEGARLWCASGLSKPPEVEAAKDDWRSEMDEMGRFIDECCVTGEGFRAAASDLYAEYKRMAEAGGERQVMTLTAFGTRLTARGFIKERSSRGVGYSGIALRNQNSVQGCV